MTDDRRTYHGNLTGIYLALSHPGIHIWLRDDGTDIETTGEKVQVCANYWVSIIVGVKRVVKRRMDEL